MIFQFSSATEDLHVKRTCVCCGSVKLILGLYFIFLCFGVWLCMIISLKQRKIKFIPGIKIEPKDIH